MADVFLSYARPNRGVAERLAHSIGEMRLSVWWDRHIKGGSEFSSDIERQLEKASKILVLWSKEATASRWVRDEANVAADTGRLVSATIDGTAPPLGFRQFQTIDLTAWAVRGAAIPPELAEALEVETPAPAVASRQPFSWRLAPSAVAAAAIAGALLLAVGAWFLVTNGRAKAAESPVIAVLPFSDLSPEKDKAYFAEGVAEAILTVLAKEPGVRVIGRSTAEQLQNAGANAEQMRRALGVTHVLEGSARSLGDQLRMSVRLINAADGQQLWAEEYQRKLDNVFAVQDEIGAAVAQRLKGSFAGSVKPPHQLASADAYTLYLAARAKTRDRRLPALRQALELAQQVIAKDPDFAPGHALKAEVIWHLSFDGYGTIPSDKARAMAEPHARRAIQLSPKSADGYAALGMISTGDAAIRPLLRAVELNPARAETRLWLAGAFNDTGRHEEALEQLEAARELEPLWFPAIRVLSSMLKASGRGNEAEDVIRRYERMGGSAAFAAAIRGEHAAYYEGDYSTAVKHLQDALRKDPSTPLAQASLAWFYHRLGLTDRVRPLVDGVPLYTRLFMLNETPALTERIFADGENVWRQGDADIAIETLGVAKQWIAIERLFDANPRFTERVCGDYRPWVQGMGLTAAAALQERKRRAEANRLIKCAKMHMQRQTAGELRSPFLSAGQAHGVIATLHALEGKPDSAFDEFERAISAGLRAAHRRGLSEFVPFDRYRAHPRYSQLDRQLKQLTASERAEVLQS